MSYNFSKIEAKWQKYWKENQTFRAKNPDSSGKTDKEPYYILDMFPYPSGAGLHVGHPLGYIASDIMSRYKRHKGFNVLHPMGYDSFGLPAEQYAIQTGQHPAITTEANINRYREQLDKIGFSFDWSREVRTSDPAYYRWTQWIFLQLFDSWYDKTEDKARPISELIERFATEGNSEVNAVNDPVRYFSAKDWNSYSVQKQKEILLNYRLTYLAETEVNWCPGLGTVLANDEVINGVSERGGFPVEQKKMMQWSMRITAYADRLLQGLDTIDWSENLKETQRNWIGKSIGTQIDFRVLPSAKNGNSISDSSKKWEICDAPNHTNQHLHKKAKEARKNPTEAEKALWAHLKDGNLGYLFKSQCILGDFIVNYVCPAKKLIVEIDAETYKKSEEYDEKRDDILQEMGYKVVHFTRTEVIDDLSAVLAKVSALLEDETETAPIIRVFTTRPDTIFGVSFMTLAPEHDLVEKITTSKQRRAVKKYVKEAAKRSERERMADAKHLSGVFTGAYAEHPFTKKPVPIWISDYVLASYGTGAVMAVPAGDDRDYRFAKHFDIPIPNIFEGIDISKEPFEEKGDTRLMNSDFLDGLSYKAAIKAVNQRLENCGYGVAQINYRLRDAVFSRQRYWGEPFPIYYKEGIPYPLPERTLPLRLPEVEKYLPTEKGEPPLGRAEVWHWHEEKEEVVAVEDPTQLPDGVYKLELNTMPGWAGSSWYFFRYMETTKRDEVFASPEALDYWNAVDLYIGGSEHATGHLLYSRFWVKFLKDRSWSPVEEPFKKLINQGMILGDSAFVHRISGKNTLISANKIGKEKTDPLHALVSLVDSHGNLDVEGFKEWRPEFKNAKFITDENGDFKVSREVEKMSKSKYNVVNPDDVCDEYGADSLRLYEMFLGPLEQSKPWNTAGLSGVYGFLNKLWRLYHSKGDLQKGEQFFYISEEKASKESLKTLHKTIAKVTEDIETFNFNTAVSSLMICVNDLTKQNCHVREVLEPLAVLVSPYAPHIAEELWEKMGHTESISEVDFPIFDQNLVKETTKTYPISFNGKKRFTMDLSLELSKAEIEQIVMEDDRTQKQLNGRTPKRVIIVPGKIVNIVG